MSTPIQRLCDEPEKRGFLRIATQPADVVRNLRAVLAEHIGKGGRPPYHVICWPGVYAALLMWEAERGIEPLPSGAHRLAVGSEILNVVFHNDPTVPEYGVGVLDNAKMAGKFEEQEEMKALQDQALSKDFFVDDVDPELQQKLKEIAT